VAKAEDIRIVFGRAVRSARTDRKISQEQLADESGLDRSYLGGVERGDRNPSLVAIDKIARGLELPLGDLFAKCDALRIQQKPLRGGRG
jgi:transcriptional regulator with XRE-family HTH domain